MDVAEFHLHSWSGYKVFAKVSPIFADARPEDSGVWACRLIDTATNYVFIESRELDIHVIGVLSYKDTK